MTLLINEIHTIDSLQNGYIVHAADRRITNNGKYDSTRKKVFEISYLNAGVGYFGLAQLNDKEFFSSWLPNFINKNSDAQSLSQFAERLTGALNQKVEKFRLKNMISGLHLCGYNRARHPEFWIIRNSRNYDENAGVYRDLKTEYYFEEEFLGRFAKEMGFESIGSIAPGHRCYYLVNGDVRSFHGIWDKLDPFLVGMFARENFKPLKGKAGLEQIAKWKLEVIASFYEEFAHKKIVGKPIDAFTLWPK
jgi:hypothetical protein